MARFKAVIVSGDAANNPQATFAWGAQVRVSAVMRLGWVGLQCRRIRYLGFFAP